MSQSLIWDFRGDGHENPGLVVGRFRNYSRGAWIPVFITHVVVERVVLEGRMRKSCLMHVFLCVEDHNFWSKDAERELWDCFRELMGVGRAGGCQNTSPAFPLNKKALALSFEIKLAREFYEAACRLFTELLRVTRVSRTWRNLPPPDVYPGSVPRRGQFVPSGVDLAEQTYWREEE